MPDAPMLARFALGPLTWDGHGWTRRRDVLVANDAWGEGIPPEPIGPGWVVWSCDQQHGEEPIDYELRLQVGGRDGICIEVGADEDGQPVYECVETFRNGVYRLDVAMDDVFAARPADRRSVSSMRADLFGALGRDGGRRRHAGKDWIENATLVLGMIERA